MKKHLSPALVLKKHNFPSTIAEDFSNVIMCSALWRRVRESLHTHLDDVEEFKARVDHFVTMLPSPRYHRRKLFDKEWHQHRAASRTHTLKYLQLKLKCRRENISGKISARQIQEVQSCPHRFWSSQSERFASINNAKMTSFLNKTCALLKNNDIDHI